MRNSNTGTHNYPRNHPNNYPFTLRIARVIVAATNSIKIYKKTCLRYLLGDAYVPKVGEHRNELPTSQPVPPLRP